MQNEAGDLSNNEKSFGLTEMQTAYLLGKKMSHSGCHTYTEYVIDDLDVERLESAWNVLIKNHLMLRCAIKKNVREYISAYRPYKIKEDVINSKFDMYYIENFRKKFTHRIFDIDDYPLYDIVVTRFIDKSVIHFLIDSWIIDGVSIEILLKQWKQLYKKDDCLISFPKKTFFDAIELMSKQKNTINYKSDEQYWANKNSKFENMSPFELNSSIDPFLKQVLVKEFSFDEFSKIKKLAMRKNILFTALMLGIFTETLNHFSTAKHFPIICTNQNRPETVEKVNEIVGSFTSSTIFWSDKSEYSFCDRFDSYKAVQKQFLEDMEHKAISGINSIKYVQKNGVEFIPIVFTVRDSLKTYESFSNDETYFCAYTPNVYLEVHIVKSNKGIAFVWNYTENAFKNINVYDIFNYNMNIVKKMLEEADGNKTKDQKLQTSEKYELTPLQNSLILGRFVNPDKNIGIFYKSFLFEKVDINKLQKALIEIFKSEFAFRLILNETFKEFVVSKEPILPEIEFLDCENQSHTEEAFVEKLMKDLEKDNTSWFKIAVSKHCEDVFKVHVILDMVIFDGISIQTFCNKLFEKYYKALNSIESENDIYAPINNSRYFGAENHLEVYEKDQLYWENRFKNANIISKDITNIGNKYNYHYFLFDEYSRIKETAKTLCIPVSVFISAIYYSVLFRWNFTEKSNFVISDYIARKTESNINLSIGDYTNLSWVFDNDTEKTFKSVCNNIKNQFYTDVLHRFGNPLAKLFSGEERKNEIPLNCVFTNCIGAPIGFLKELKVGKSKAISHGVMIDCVVSSDKENLMVEWMVLDEFVSNSASEKMFSEFKSMLKLLVDNVNLVNKSLLELNLGTSKKERAFLTNNNSRLSKELFEKIIYDFNNTSTGYNRTILIHNLFEENVEKYPDAVAVITDNETITYGELNKRANFLARKLKSKMLLKKYIAVYFSPGIDLVISILAILKIGCAYVPINIDDPIERVRIIIDTAEVELVLTDQNNMYLLKELKVDVLTVNKEQFDLKDVDSCENLNDEISSEDLAYVIFTSGSTGTPKGVMVPHKPVINLIEWAKRVFDFSRNDRVIFLNPINFDLSVFDIFGMLSYGASIRIVSKQDKHNPYKLINIINDENITFWNTAPAYFQILFSVLKDNNVLNSTMKIFFLSGDWIPVDIFYKVASHFPSASVVGLGGATEATVWSNYFKITTDYSGIRNSIPYGKPIQNVKYYILDDTLSPCDVGTKGMLFIGGECLSKGYINNPKMSRKSFVYDPFCEDGKTVMYNTGDLAQYMQDGNIEFLGRADLQIKVQGYRIEIGEIESALRKIGVCNPIVLTKTDKFGNKSLVAFGQIKGFTGIINDFSLREKLSKLLPTYMIPNNIYSVNSIPMTTNGKIDNKKLLDMVSENVVQIENNKVPHEDKSQKIETKNIDITKLVDKAIKKVLGFDKEKIIDQNTNLGHIGFTSLQYVLLGVELSERLGQEINPALFFRYTTSKQISLFIEKEVLKGFKKQETISNSEEEKVKNQFNHTFNDTDIAIIGATCRLPGAENVEEFWKNLIDKKVFKQSIPRKRWKSSLDKKNEEYGNFISGIENFDSEFFNIIPREAESMDPRQRILLQSTWNVLEDAGYSPSKLRGSNMGFFVGCTGHDYEKIALSNKHIDEFTLMGVSKTLIANRISYFYDWHGPSEVVDTACSSSLVAIHHAVRAICNNECHMAIAGGINLIIDSEAHLCLKRIGMLAKDGISKTFDKQGDGYARGEGCVLMLLKPLSMAIKDNDNIYAVIKSTAINHGGKANSLTAPNMNAQIDVITKAYEKSKINPRQLGYIETHGTGTALGDPIEVESIKESIKNIYAHNGIESKNKVVLGAVKPNIGHLEAAAGVAGLLKLVLAIKNKKFPGNVYPKVLNPNINISDTNIEINSIEGNWATPFSESGLPLKRVGGVSSFGFGGVNAHVVLEEYARENETSDNSFDEEDIFILSAKSKYSLREVAKEYVSFLKEHRNINISDLCGTLKFGREHLPYRLAIISGSLEHIICGLENYLGNINQGFVEGNIYEDKEKIKYLSSSVDFDLLDIYTKARLWSYGLNVLWKNTKLFRKISLPLYQFKKTAYWINNHPDKFEITTSIESKDLMYSIRNLNFKLTGKERFIKEHIINNEMVLPGASYLPYIQYVCNLKLPFKITGLVWLNQVKEGMFPIDMNICIKEHGFVKEVDFYTNYKNAKQINCIAKAEPIKIQSLGRINIENLKSVSKAGYLKNEIYSKFSDNKIKYGKMFMGIEKIWLGSNDSLAKISLGSFSTKLDIPFAVVDCGLQSIVFQKLLEDSKQSWFPFSVESIKCFGKLKREGYVYSRHNNGTNSSESSDDIFITDNQGTILMQIIACVGRRGKEKLNFLKKEWIKLKTKCSSEKSDHSKNQVDLFLGNYENYLTGNVHLNCYIKADITDNFIDVRSTDLNNFKIGTNTTNDLLNNLSSENKFIKRIIYFPSNNSLKDMFNICRFFYKIKNKIQFFIIDTEKDSVNSSLNHSLYAWGKCFEKENNYFEFLYLNMFFSGFSLNMLGNIQKLKDDFNYSEFIIEGENDIFYRKVVVESSKEKLWNNEFKIVPNASYLITGGMGKIGQQIAKLVSEHGGIPILVGRHVNNENINENIKNVVCYACDIGRKSDVQNMFNLIRQNHDGIRGIFHCAGINKDKLLYSKKYEDVVEVISPKVQGTIYIDEITKNESLDFFIMFSSISSTLYNVGQTDYSYANMFMDDFSEVRNLLVEKGLRKGETCSISWPFVRNAGMSMSDKLLSSLEFQTGIKSIDVSEISNLVLRQYKNSHITIIPGDKEKICKYIQENT